MYSPRSITLISKIAGLFLLAAGAWAAPSWEVVNSSNAPAEINRISKALTGAEGMGGSSDGFGTYSLYWFQPSTYTVLAAPNALDEGD